MLLVPVLFVTAFELTRLGTDGPTVDGIHTTLYGMLAFGVGRGFQTLVSVLPMVLGCTVGAAVGRRPPVQNEGVTMPSSHRRRRSARRVLTVVAAIGLLGFTLLLARPATTARITGSDGSARAGSVAELTTVQVDGRSLGMMIRGHSTNNPVLLFLAGATSSLIHQFV